MRRLLGALVLVAGSLLVPAGSVVAGPATPAARAFSTPVVTVTPDSGLVDFSPVQVSASNIDLPFIELYECRADPVNGDDCDADNGFEVDVSSSGTIDETFYVDARMYLQGGDEVDCRVAPGCVIGVGLLTDAGEWPVVPITFDPDAPLRPPVTATVTPSTGLADEQTVQVHGENLSFREETFARVCVAGASPIDGAQCDLRPDDTRGVADQDGTIDLELPVRRVFWTPLDGQVDCATVAGGCSVMVSWGFTAEPDRYAEVPISFAAQETTTTSSTTTTAPADTTTTTSPAPAPVPATAAFTG